MSLKRTLIKNSSYNIVAYLYLIIASLISIPILLRNLGSDLYGVYIIFTSMAPLLSAFDFGFSQATIRYLSLPDLNKKIRLRYWQSSLAVFLLLAFFLALASFFILNFYTNSTPALRSISGSTGLLYAAIIALTLLVNHLNIALLTIPQANQRFDIYNLRTFIVGSGNTILSAYLSNLYPSISFILIFQLIFHLISFLILSLYSIKVFSISALIPHIHITEVKKLFNFGIRQFIGNISSQINFHFSKFILASSLSVQAVSYFSIPQNVITKAAGGVSQLALAFFPLSASLTTPERLRKLKQLILGVQFLILLGGILEVFLVYTFGYSLMLLWLKDPQFVNASYPIIKILSWYFLLTALTPIITVVFDSLNFPHIPSIFSVLTTILTLLFLFFFIPLYGASGAALAYVASAAITVPAFLLVFALVFNKRLRTLS